MTISIEVNGRPVAVDDEHTSLLVVLREQLHLTSVKDGCSPQGQCGCCTVLVDGAPRVSCVTPVRRVAGRSIRTVDGLDSDERARWADAFWVTGGSQCGFCTPGIIVRLAGMDEKMAVAGGTTGASDEDVQRALAAHLCRCTGWQTIVDAYHRKHGGAIGAVAERDRDAAARRAQIEGHALQSVGPEVALGLGGFADDCAPEGALVAVPAQDGGWSVAETLGKARSQSRKVQGRRSTVTPEPPLDVPSDASGEGWALMLRTSWVEPGYLETDASWCEPGGEPMTPLANGGAFGGKEHTVVTSAARRLADEHGRAVRVLLSREDAVRLGPKRPPMALALRADGSGVARLVRTPGVANRVGSAGLPIVVEEVDVAGPPTSVAVRAAGWAEVAVVAAAWRATCAAAVDGSGWSAASIPAGVSVPSDGGLGGAQVRPLVGVPVEVTAPNGARATASVDEDGGLQVAVACGEVLDDVVLRSYCIGAAHMALSWVTSEALAVDAAGEIHDLTIRSFGILRALDTPPITVAVDHDDRREPMNGSDAVFAAVAAAAWLRQGCPPSWPTRLRWP